MTNAKQVIIWLLCIWLGLESVIFINTGFKIFDNKDRGIFSLFERNKEENTDTKQTDENQEGDEDTSETEPNNSQIDEEREMILSAIAEAEKRGLLILVNKKHSVGEDYKPDDLAPIKYYAKDRSEASRYMRQEAADHFHILVESAKDEGYELVMTTAYRSYGFQQILWNNYVAREGEEAANKFSAKPGESEHQTGLAVDVSSPSVNYQLTESFGDTEEGKWLADNAHCFGFIIRYPKGKEDVTGYQYEPWHIRYVGKEIAAYIYQNDLTLEEFFENINGYR